MIRKMIGALSLPECKEVVEALEERLYYATSPTSDEKDYALNLTEANKALREVKKCLDTHYQLSLLDRYYIGGFASDTLKGLAETSTTLACILYLKDELFPGMSVREAKDRFDLWKEQHRVS